MKLRSSAMAGLAVLALSGGLAACGGGDDDSATTSTSSSAATDLGSVTIGAFNFSESTILANLYSGVLDKAGYKTSIKSLGAREVVEPALEKGSGSGGVDVVPEYLSTFTEFENTKANGADATAVASGDVAATVTAGQKLANAVGITLLTPSPATDENSFAVTADFATKNKLSTLSDLASYTGDLVLGGPPECPTRPFCQPGLENTYGIKFSGFKSLDSGGPLTKAAIKDGTVQIGLVFSSDGGIQSNGLKVLTDDKKLQNADNVVPAVNTKANKAALSKALDALSGELTTDDLIDMNKQVDVDHADADDVAKKWLSDHNLG